MAVALASWLMLLEQAGFTLGGRFNADKLMTLQSADNAAIVLEANHILCFPVKSESFIITTAFTLFLALTTT